jgi:hypothetical protein
MWAIIAGAILHYEVGSLGQEKRAPSGALFTPKGSFL